MMKKTIEFYLLISGMVFLVALVSCRGQFSEEAPLHLNPNMDSQAKKKPQSEIRQIPDGTVPFGYEEDVHMGGEGNSRDRFLKENASFYSGKDKNGNFLARIPMKVDMKLLLRGQERFNIYCAACHDRAGTSQSIVVKRGVGIPPPPNLASDNVVIQSDGQLYSTIKNGIRNMSGYGKQIDTEDMWAIVSYVRAIQVSRNTAANEVPTQVIEKLKSKNNNN